MENELTTIAAQDLEMIEAPVENQLMRVIRTSGLDLTKAQVLMEKFNGYFEIAASWEAKARMLQITSTDQVADMKTAREGRLFLKDKRVAVEKTRKTLKETSLREGQTIDAIAKILTNLITPIEEDLELKEKYAEIFEANRQSELRYSRIEELAPFAEFVPDHIDLGAMDQENYTKILEGARMQTDAKKLADIKAEQDRIQARADQLEADKAEEVERQRVITENARLKVIADAKEKELAAERDKAAKAAGLALIEKAALLAELEKAEKAAAASAKAAAASAKAAAKIIQDAKDKAAQQLKEQAAAERKAKAAPDKEKLMYLAHRIMSLQMPELASEEAKSILKNVTGLLVKVETYITEQTEKL